MSKKKQEVEDLLKTYPRSRVPLSERHQAVFVENYRQSRQGKGRLLSIVSWLESWMHKMVASAGGGSKVLELGGGTLNHVPFEPKSDSYDVIEPFKDLWVDSPNRDKVRRIFQNIEDVPLSNQYDRIISVAVLEHLTDLPRTLATSCLLLGPDGHFQAGIPSEGGVLWGLSWRCTTGIAYRLRTGLDYATVMRHEHVNDAQEIIALVKFFFENVQIKRFPLFFHHGSFYVFLNASGPKKGYSHHFLKL